MIDAPLAPCSVAAIPSIVIGYSEGLEESVTEVPVEVTAGDAGEASATPSPAVAPETAVVVPASNPETSSMFTAPELTATVPKPTVVVAVTPRRSNGP